MKFILQLICIVSPYPWSPRQILPSPSYVICPPPRQNNFQSSSLFLLTPLFWGYLDFQVKISKILNSLDYHPCPSRLAPKMYPYLGPYSSLQNGCWIFLKLLYSTICGENFEIYGVHIPRKCIDLRHFYSCPSPFKTHPQVHHALGRRKLLIPPGSILSKICFPQQQKGVEETIICFIKIQSENMKMIWNITFFIFFMTCNFFKCDGCTVL